jgi:hypothetical protein
MRLNREQYKTIVAKVNEDEEMGLSEKDQEVLANKLFHTKKVFDTEPEWTSLVKSIKFAEENNPLKQDRKVNAVSQLSKCPITGKEGELVYLMRGRPAFYFKDHKILQPLDLESMETMGIDYTTTVNQEG